MVLNSAHQSQLTIPSVLQQRCPLQVNNTYLITYRVAPCSFLWPTRTWSDFPLDLWLSAVFKQCQEVSAKKNQENEGRVEGNLSLQRSSEFKLHYFKDCWVGTTDLDFLQG